MSAEGTLLRIEKAFAADGIGVVGVEERQFPQETHVLVFVTPEDHTRALVLAGTLDIETEDGDDVYVIVRKSAQVAEDAQSLGRVKSVHDERCDQLVKLVSAHNRVSDAQPSLAYVPDARASIAAVSAARHNLIFGRRGAGKTALMVEAKRQLERSGALAVWVNIQTYRHEDPYRIVLYVLNEMLRSIQISRVIPPSSQVALRVIKLANDVQYLLDATTTDATAVRVLVPRAHQVVRDALDVVAEPMFVFLDDFYYLERKQQPLVLDLLHGIVRDVNAWLKIASIRHLTRWWQASPPMGLQSGQDAELIDLDITLQDPSLAKKFLEGVLFEFAKRAHISSLSQVFRSEALDRLVIASGAVPRDFLVLATSAISRARRREKALLVGVQDVNQAAGDAGAAKKQELEEDMASNVGSAERTMTTLGKVRSFCLEEKGFTYFLVDLREREERASAYTLLTDLMDVRLLHLVDASVSDAHEAGRKYEAYMLDLSEYSGSRLKHRLTVLDFVDGKFQSKQTRTGTKPRIARTSREFTAILRGAPALSLAMLAETATEDG
ncbi:hypothetical protein NH287_14395 [Microbacterium sp. CnD16-F]|uniref:hypothetical protein n=1 Tax=Microbacterium sp. CnD16-F TaxID=2954493 RepID=UPI0020979EEE|nr:hypothetical protein [Microbacterium sp. CnD16-F]MCO7204677.1 hypothetical protein [Microbacterium sp. CnD16-F]